MKNVNKKILNKISLLKKTKKIGLCHGVFDILHTGHIEYLKEAKSFCDVLVVSITTDKFVKKGVNRPYFNIKKRKLLLSSIKYVDFVVESNYPTGVNVIKKIKPHFYIKGPDYKNAKNDITQNLQKEIEAIRKVKGKFLNTSGRIFSSSKIFNENFSNLNGKQRTFLNKIKNKYSISKIKKIFLDIKKINLNVIGETILDQYILCEALGKSGKEPLLTFRDKKDEIFLGGALSVANNLSFFVNKVNFVSYLGQKEEYKNLIKKKQPKNCNYFFVKKYNSPTIIKKRYLDEASLSKIFGLYKIQDSMLKKKEDLILINFLKKIKKTSDLSIILDYGHGLISQKSAKYLCTFKNTFLNAQINSANIGYHSLNKYNYINTVIINETELRHELRDRNIVVEKLIKKICIEKKIKNIIVTRGRDGSVFYSLKDKKFIYCPAFERNALDKIGAGDTLLFIFSLFFHLSKSPELSLYIASLAAAESVRNFANSKSIIPQELLKVIEHSIK